jgi:triosephosphate isomerase
MRMPIIAGNWKMHNTVGEALALVKDLARRVAAQEQVEVVVCPPFTALYAVAQALAGTRIALGAQNLFWEEQGAFTGEVSPLMLKDVGVKYVIVGHSERRAYQRESDEEVAKKLTAAFRADLTPILCVGEQLAEREAGRAEAVVGAQLAADLTGLDGAAVQKLVIAYEPIWAIGTGRSAQPEDAAAMAAFIRRKIETAFGKEAAAALRIQYGGSVSPANSREFLTQEGIDGALVGGASLKADSFAAIVAAAHK